LKSEDWLSDFSTASQSSAMVSGIEIQPRENLSLKTLETPEIGRVGAESSRGPWVFRRVFVTRQG
jgi:hypothetical protein